MTAPTVSVIVVSRGRPRELTRCLAGLRQLYHEGFELIVVCDPAGVAAVAQAPGAASIRQVAFDEANISAARNLGLAHAAGGIVAFIDDDAVPEPTWLDNLTEPFADPGVAAAGGFVIGRNGISLQSTASVVDARGFDAAIAPWGDAPKVFDTAPGRAIKTVGTNSAFRRDLLLKMGGFDPALRFFLDETDVNMRLAARGARTAICPLAQVHHGFAASPMRRASRMPRTLYEIGASRMVFLRKHASRKDWEPALTRMRQEQRARLIRHMVAGNCEPRDVGRVLRSLDDGIAAGRVRRIAPLPPIAASQEGFQPLPRAPRPRGSALLAGRIWAAAGLRRQAAELAAGGRPVSLFLFSPTALYHRVAFTRHGVWEQRGGLFGKSRRDDRLIWPWRFARRVRRETGRVDPVRLFTD